MHKGRFMKAAVLGLCAALLLPSACLAAKGKKGIPGPARKQLTRELDAMVGHNGTHVPGLGVEVYKNGKKAYTHFAGHRYFAEKPGQKDLPITAKPDSGPLPYPKCSPPSPSCSWWMKEN